MSRLLKALAVGALVLGGPTVARASIVITVDKSAQELTVEVDGQPRYQWPVSTARMGYRTPNGAYRPQRLERMWNSRLYDWSPMPYSIFFNGGYAIHGTYETRHLGSPASHGCIRLSPKHAAVLFALVQSHMGSTRIVVTGAGAEAMPRTVRETLPSPRNVRETLPSPRSVRARPHVQPGESFEDVFGNRPRYYRNEDGGEYYFTPLWR